MAKLRRLSGVLVITILSVVLLQVNSFPRKKLVSGLTDNNDRSSRLASVLSDFWTERGFTDALTDHFLASESQGKDLLMSGDEAVPEFRGKNKIRLPRGRLTPPGRALASKYHDSVVKTLAASRKRQQRKRLAAAMSQRRRHYPRVHVMNPIAATRKQDDMEILESVTLIDGGTPQSDGTIKIRPSSTQSQRKYQQDQEYENGQISPLNYQLQDDDLTLSFNKQQEYPQQGPPLSRHQPVISASYYPLQQHHEYSSNDLQGKLSLGQVKQQKPVSALQSMSLNQFQQQLFHQQQQQQRQPVQQHKPQQTVYYSTPKPQVLPIFVIPQPQKTKHSQASFALPPLPTSPPSHTPTRIQQTPTTRPPPSRPSPSPPQALPSTNFNAQLFQQQFHHPFATQPPAPISSLAQFTASLLSGASSVAAATQAAANALAKGELLLPSPPSPSSQSQAAFASAPIPRYTGFSPSSLQESSHGPLSGGLLAAASIPSGSHAQILLPTTPSPFASPTSPRTGVIAEEDQPVTNQLLDEKDNLANKITQLVETGRKILYFPKGVVDTVDVMLKQMERNPMIAYWGDKFFAKVFGDTSGT